MENRMVCEAIQPKRVIATEIDGTTSVEQAGESIRGPYLAFWMSLYSVIAVITQEEN